MDYLPNDVIFNILTRLPVKLLLRCRTISKLWRDIIDHPLLSIMQVTITAKEPMLLALTCHPICLISETENHQQAATIVQPPSNQTIAKFAISTMFTLNNSCNGFICFAEHANRFITTHAHNNNKDQLFVCNTLKPEVIALPPCSLLKSRQIDGLGFCPSTQEYKVIRISDDFNSGQSTIHTLGTGVWRTISSVPPYPIYGRPVFANGALYWKINTCLYWRHRRTEDRIVLFDMEKEVFEVAKLPPQLGSEQNHLIYLIELRGRLALVDCSFDTHIDIWVLKEEKQWIREYRINMEAPKGRSNNRHIEVLGHLGDQVIFLSKYNACYSYNPSTDTRTKVRVSWMDPDISIKEIFNSHTWSMVYQ